MTNYEAWKIINQCKGYNFSFKGIPSNMPYSFKITHKKSNYTLVVHSYWQLSYYDEVYYKSYNLPDNFPVGLLLKHPNEDFIITGVSLTDTFKLQFSLQGNMQFSIPELTNPPFDFNGLIKPKWELKKGDKTLILSP